MNSSQPIFKRRSRMISRASSSFQSGIQMFHDEAVDLVSPNSSATNSHSTSSSSLLFNLSVLKDKISEVQTLVGVIVSPDQSLPESTSMAISSMNSTIQEIIVTATSMMFTCQQLTLTYPNPGTTSNCSNQLHRQQDKLSQSNFGHNNKDGVIISNANSIDTSYIRGQSLFPSNNDEAEALEWFGHESYNNNNNNKVDDNQGFGINENNNNNNVSDEGYGGMMNNVSSNDMIIELDAADLLAKYTHYCQVCGKGFKRDANLRMHMRAHGDEYKTNSALSNPIKSSNSECNNLMSVKPKKYSCPQEGCRWNQKHAKFQPLKSMICVKNHYKRSHCPKMYVCKRCNLKQFSVLSDLRTHEKHCGHLKWQCSCGTSFSRKDKLMGHVALFVGHHPVGNGLSHLTGKLEQGGLQMQISRRSR